MTVEIMRPYEDHILGVDKAQTLDIAPGIKLIHNVVYNDDNYGNTNVAYATVSLWDAHNRKEIDFDSTGDFSLDDEGNFVYPDRMLKSQQELSQEIVNKHIPEIQEISREHIESLKLPSSDFDM